MADPDPQGTVRCRCFTYPRRFQLVIGKVGGTTLWFPLSIAQMVTLCGSAVVLFYTQALWAHLSAAGNLFVGLGLPVALTYLVRYLRLEGRSPLRTLLGVATYLGAPRAGLHHGRAYRPPRPAWLTARVPVHPEHRGGER